MAWGKNDYGQIGNNTTDDAPTPVNVKAGAQNPGNPNAFLQWIISISASKFGNASGYHSLAVDVNNFCYFWGRNQYDGQAGDGTRYNNKLTPIQVKSGEMGGGTYLHDIIAVSAGEDHSMALDTNGYVWTWGQNSYDYDGAGKGRLGAGNTTADYNSLPVKVHGPNNVGHLENIVAVSAGWNHCVALEDIYPLDSNKQGRVYTWGYNGITGTSSRSRSGGRLGDGTTTDAGSSPL